ncbi:hypothetical protein PIB30_069149 [Stylosanthes scabra]|uniref:NB-ARC domain-containing protein n=1 Tax=Stylosanthes scabra TaxID=79078 RepID=A0ABU6WN03_9FABA|nr:hypothetical protein [Stylosanthes scabra]
MKDKENKEKEKYVKFEVASKDTCITENDNKYNSKEENGDAKDANSNKKKNEDIFKKVILITTRNDQMAYFSRSKEPHHNISLMDEEESWELFCNEVFDNGEECPAELEPIGRSISESCKGLPLAIITTAGIVAKRERLEDAWEEIMDLLPYWCVVEDKDGSEGIMKILKFSYDDLPNKMKPCFLYLGAFPEDDEIRVRDLIRLWIAEGFIEPIQTGRSRAPPEPEDIGEQYLKELVDRNLVQLVASRRSDGKGVKTCRIHDLFQELCISESNNNNAHRLFFPREIESYACSITCNQSCTCSLLVYGDASEGWSHDIPEDSRVNVLYFTQWTDCSATILEYLKGLKPLRYLGMAYFDELTWSMWSLMMILIDFSEATPLYCFFSKRCILIFFVERPLLEWMSMLLHL